MTNRILSFARRIARLSLLYVGFSLCAASDARGLMLLSETGQPGNSFEIEVQEDVLFIANGGGGLRIMDVSDPSTPVDLATEFGESSVTRLDVEAGVAYITTSAVDVRIVDITNPAVPTELGVIDLLVEVTDLVVDDGIAYLVTREEQSPFTRALRAFDVSDPSAPVELSPCPLSSETGEIEVIDGIAYLGQGSLGLSMIDVSDPNAALHLATIDTPGSVIGFEVVGDLAYIADGKEGLRIIDVSDRLAPVELSSIPNSHFPDENASDVTVVDGVAYVSLWRVGLWAVDVSDPTAPVHLGTLSLPGSFLFVTHADGVVYVSSQVSGVFLVDPTDPTTPAELSTIVTPETARTMDLVDALGYVTNFQVGGVRIIDFSNPALPIEVGAVDTPYIPWDVSVSGGIAYVADGSQGGLRIYDVANPAQPFELGNSQIPVNATTVEFVDPLLYLGDSTRGLRIFDVSDPATPQQLGFSPLTTIGGIGSIRVDGDFAFLAAGIGGLKIVDVSDPSAPVEVSEFTPPWKCNGCEQNHCLAVGVDVVGNYAFLSCDRNSMRVIDISDRGLPTEVAIFPYRGYSHGRIEIVDDRAYLSFGSSSGAGVEVLDVSVPTAPRRLGAFSTADQSASDVLVRDGLVYVGAGSRGAQVIDFGALYLAELEVTIDVEPGNAHNLVHPGSWTLLPVAILGAPDLAVEQIDRESLRFGPAQSASVSPNWTYTVDVDGDRFDDLLSFFWIPDTGIAEGDVQACLEAALLSGRAIGGCDFVDTVSGCGRGFELALLLPPILWWRGRRHSLRP